MGKFNWKSFIKELNTPNNEITYKLNSPCKKAEVFRAELRLNADFHEEFKELYFQGNGICEFLNESHIGNLIMPIEEVIEINLNFRKEEAFKDLYMPFDNLLFFGRAGNGDLFGFRILQNKILESDVYVWNHEDDSRNWVAKDLVDFVKRWTSGQINI